MPVIVPWAAVCASLLGLQGYQDAHADGIATYSIDNTTSELHVLVHRAGALARLGHNHIIAAGAMEGTVYLDPEVPKSTMDLTLPVAGFVIDDRELRQIEGEGFASVPSQKDIDGTRRNMVGKKLLDVMNFPTIHVSGRVLQADEQGNKTIEIQILVKNASAVRRVPVALSIEDERISASGTVVLNHEELGLKPFSAALGTLKVAKPITVRFSLDFRRTN